MWEIRDWEIRDWELEIGEIRRLGNWRVGDIENNEFGE